MTPYFGFQAGVPLNYGSDTPVQGAFTGQQPMGDINPMMAMAAMNMMNQPRTQQPGQRPNIGSSLMSAALPLAMMAKQGGGLGGLMGGMGGAAGPQDPGTLFGANNATGQMFGGQSAAPMMNGIGNQFGFGAMPAASGSGALGQFSMLGG